MQRPLMKGVIFDVDDTLLDNKSEDPEKSMHGRARLAAFHQVGDHHDIPVLSELTMEENLNGFLTAPVHTLESAIWNILWQKGLVDSEIMNPQHPLLLEVVALKDEFYEIILRDEGEEVPGAGDFVRFLAERGLGDRMAIASTAIRRDVDTFLSKTALFRYFPDGRIKTKESITHPKPNPEVFDLAFSTLGLPEEDRSSVYVVEDDPRGIMGGKAAGLFVVGITTRYRRETLEQLEVAPDLIVDSFAELQELLKIN